MSSPYVSLLEALRAHCNLPEFPNPLPSNQLVLELENGPSITIDFEEETSAVVLFAEIGTYQLEHEVAVLSSIAQANFLWAATSGGTLSARPDIQTVYLAQQFPVHFLEGEPFIKLVEEFARVTQQWKTILEGIEKGGSKPLEEAATHSDTPSEEAAAPATA
ncbi:MAG: type III secretion system chaperone [Chthoniobacterales bacterium]